MTNALLELYQHNTWATLQLIEHCQGLANETLELTTPGTFGTIRETLLHLVGAEEGYFSIVTRKSPFEPIADYPARLDELGDGPVSLTELAERIRTLGPRWERLAEDADAARREVATQDGWRMPAAVPMAQAIHHGENHRSHVLSILGAHGLEVPDLQVWEYAFTTGQMTELQPASSA